MVIGLVYAGQLLRDRPRAVSAMIAFLITGPVGVIFYNLLPAVGPIHIFLSRISLEADSHRASDAVVGGTHCSSGPTELHAVAAHELGIAGVVVFARALDLGTGDRDGVFGIHDFGDHGNWRALFDRPDCSFSVCCVLAGSVRARIAVERPGAGGCGCIWIVVDARMDLRPPSCVKSFLDVSGYTVGLLHSDGGIGDFFAEKFGSGYGWP